MVWLWRKMSRCVKKGVALFIFCSRVEGGGGREGYLVEENEI